ncbi:MAG TPA: TolC family protein, partial [Myxococcota bacterium]|nr:TolC family protein [Myxococcota bacterium]
MKTSPLIIAVCLSALSPLQTSAFATAPTPLSDVLTAARRFELGLALSEQQVAIAKASRDTQEGGLWPRLEARLSYTRNQHDAVVSLPVGDSTRSVTITPFDQLEAQATLTVPILDLGLRARIGASELRVEGLSAQRESAVAALDERVATAYFQVAFAQSRRDLAAADVELIALRIRELAVRQRAGFENRLVLETAQADLERARREVAAAAYDLASARLDLEVLSGKPEVVASLNGLNPP